MENPFDSLEVGFLGARTGQLPEQELPVNRDARQGVVDLMYDASSELSECRQFFGVNHLTFELADLGTVLSDGDSAGDIPLGIQNRCEREFKTCVSAPGLRQRELERGHVSASKRVREGR